MSRLASIALLLALFCAGCCTGFRDGRDAFNQAQRNRSFPETHADHAERARTLLLTALDECSLSAEEKTQAHLLLVELHLNEPDWEKATAHLDQARALQHPTVLPEQDRAFFHLVQGDILAHSAVEIFSSGTAAGSPADLQGHLESCRRQLKSAMLEYKAARGLARTERLKSLVTLRQVRTQTNFARTLEIGTRETEELRLPLAEGFLEQAAQTLETAEFAPDALEPAKRLLTEIRSEQKLLRDRLAKEKE